MHALPDVRDLQTSSNCCYRSPPFRWPRDQKKRRLWGQECGWMQPTFMCSVSFAGKFSSGSRVSVSRSHLLKVRIMKIVVSNLQFGDCWVNNQEHLLLKTTTCVVVFYERKVNDEITDQTRKSTIERRWVVAEIYLTAIVNAITHWINIKYHICFPYLRVCWIFVRYSSSHARVLMARIPETTWFIKEMRLSDNAAVRKRSAALT